MSVGNSFDIDISQLTRFAERLGRQGPLIVRDELTTGMERATKRVQNRANARIHHRGKGKPPLARGWKRQVRVSTNTILGIVSNVAPHAKYVEFGRGPIVAKRARALRFEIGGRVLYRKRVGPAAGQHFLQRGAQDARGEIQGEFAAVAERIARRLVTR